jgi:hypothetical protein
LKAFLTTAFFVLIAVLSRAQTINNTSFNLEAVIGLNFYNETISVINQEQIVPQDLQPENYFRFQVIPKINFLAFGDKFSLGTHLGFGYESFKTPERDNKRVTSKLFKIGGQLQYEIFEAYGFRPYIELGSNYNLYEASAILDHTDSTVNYLKSYVDIGVRIQATRSIDVSLLLKDFFTYHSNSTNFERAEDFTLRPSFRDFLQFTHFSVRYTL